MNFFWFSMTTFFWSSGDRFCINRRSGRVNSSDRFSINRNSLSSDRSWYGIFRINSNSLSNDRSITNSFAASTGDSSSGSRMPGLTGTAGTTGTVGTAGTVGLSIVLLSFFDSTLGVKFFVLL